MFYKVVLKLYYYIMRYFMLFIPFLQVIADDSGNLSLIISERSINFVNDQILNHKRLHNAFKLLVFIFQTETKFYNRKLSQLPTRNDIVIKATVLALGARPLPTRKLHKSAPGRGIVLKTVLSCLLYVSIVKHPLLFFPYVSTQFDNSILPYMGIFTFSFPLVSRFLYIF